MTSLDERFDISLKLEFYRERFPEIGHLRSAEPRFYRRGMEIQYNENQLFLVIAAGKPNTARPGFKNMLTALQRAEVLRCIEYFADAVSRARIEMGSDGQLIAN